MLQHLDSFAMCLCIVLFWLFLSNRLLSKSRSCTTSSSKWTQHKWKLIHLARPLMEEVTQRVTVTVSLVKGLDTNARGDSKKRRKKLETVVVVDCFYIALFSALEQTHCTHMWFWISDYLLIACFRISTEVVYVQCYLVVTWLVPHETAAIWAWSVYTIQSCTMSRHLMQSHICRVHTGLAVTCHLHFWQNDGDLLHATAITQGWNGILK